MNKALTLNSLCLVLVMYFVPNSYQFLNDSMRMLDGRIWPVDNPVLNASSVDEIYSHLCSLENIDFRKKIHEQSKQFVLHHMAPEKMLHDVFVI